MSTMGSPRPHEGRLCCTACARHKRPEMVPWLQHAIGCPVRAAELSRQAAQRAAYASPMPMPQTLSLVAR